MDDRERSVARFNRRGETDLDYPWHSHVRAVIAAQGGGEALRRRHSALRALPGRRLDAVVIETSEGSVEDTYQRLLASLAE